MMIKHFVYYSYNKQNYMDIYQAIKWCNKLGRGYLVYYLVYYVVYRPLNNDYITCPQSHIKRYDNDNIFYNSKDKMFYTYPISLFLPFKN
jgi:hypothetical protein